MRSAGQKVSQGVSSAKEAAVRGSRKASDWFNPTPETNPMVLAVASLGLGLIAGLSLPISQAEKDTAGRPGERIVGSVLDKSANALEKTETPAPADSDPRMDAGL